MRPIATTLLLAGLVLAAGCSKNNPVSNPTGTVRLQMTDGPGPFDAVHLVVTQVAVHRGGETDASGWEIVRSDTATYDLMELRNGVFAALGQAIVPAGHYTQIRLVIGDGSTVTVDGVPHPLTIPSGYQTGYKLVGPFDVPANGLVDLALDFDAARSIHLAGDGTWVLYPVCRVMPFSTAGSIAGRILPITATVTVLAMVGADTVATTVPGNDGAFVLAPLAGGAYDVAIRSTGAWRDTTIAGVAVTAQHTTTVPDVALTPQ